MPLSQSALSELLEAYRTSDGVDMIHESVRTVLQELVEFEAAGVIGGRALRAHRGPRHRTHRHPSQAAEPSRPVTPSCGSPSSARAPTSRASWSPTSGSTRPSTR